MIWYLEECRTVGYDESALELEAMMTSQRILSGN